VLAKAGAPDLKYTHINNEELLQKGSRPGEGGIFYRPRMPYPIHVYLRDNPRVPRWRLGISRVIEMENIAPLVAVGVDRTLFTQRKTTLLFEEGALSNVCIYKASEMQQAVQIPLQVVQSVVDLPAQIVTAKFNNTNNQKELLAAQDQLLKTQTSYLDFLKNPKATYTDPDLKNNKGNVTGLGTVPDPANPIYSPLTRGTSPNIIKDFTDIKTVENSNQQLIPTGVCPTATGATAANFPGLKFQPIFTPTP
jgi:hypothetical protein